MSDLRTAAASRPQGGPPGRDRHRAVLLTALGAACAFCLLTLHVVGVLPRTGPPDTWAHAWSVDHRPAEAAAAATLLTDTGTGFVPYVMTALAGFLTVRGVRKRVLALAAFLACLVVGQAVRLAVSLAVARPRPPAVDWAAPASGWSFPSGHTATSAVAAGLVGWALLRHRPPGTTALLILLGCWAVAVGLTRVYLGVHWATDVVGGWLFAAVWVLCCTVPLGRLPDTAPAAR